MLKTANLKINNNNNIFVYKSIMNKLNLEPYHTNTLGDILDGHTGENANLI